MSSNLNSVRIRPAWFGSESKSRARALEGVDTLLAHARDLENIAIYFAPKQHRIALGLIRSDRIYCFERNTQRWPDGRWYMLNRGYQFWRGFRIAFTRDELVALGVERWAASSAIRTAYSDGMLPMAAECFQYNPRRWVRAYAQLVEGIALAHEAHVETDIQAGAL